MKITKITLWSIGLGLLLAVPAQAVDITACGQLVPAGDVGVLQDDLDCGGDEAAGRCLEPAAVACAENPACTDTGCGGIVLRADATLQMNGHTVANGTVSCPLKSCSIIGPGVIAGGYGLDSTGTGTLTVSGGLDVHGGEIGIAAYTGHAVLQDVTVSDVENNWGIIGFRKLLLTNVTANDCEIGILAYGPLKGSNITANDNTRAGIVAVRSVKVTGLMATGNGATPEGTGGVQAAKGLVRLVDSVVTGNFFQGTTPLDLNTARRPRLIDSTCEHSGLRGTATGSAWGVCSQD